MTQAEIADLFVGEGHTTSDSETRTNQSNGDRHCSLFIICSNFITKMDVMIRFDDDAPSAAKALGLDKRYSYLRGASGKRYLFTVVPDGSVAEYPGAVVVLAAPGRDEARQILWVGEIDAKGYRHGQKVSRSRRRADALVHLLAEDEAARRLVIRDLWDDVERDAEPRP